MHCVRLLSWFVFIAVFLARSQVVHSVEVYRFLDHSTVPVITLGIGGVFKRALNPFRTQEAFELPELNGAAVLSFAIGQQPVEGSGTVRFEIELERSGTWTPLYQKDLSEPGWVDERITLPGDLGKAQVRFRRKLVSGPVRRAEKSAWGDPILLPAAPEKRPSVILISLDTLRADRLGLYGHTSARTPVLDQFGRSGVWYAQAYSPSAWTLPSHASLFYGRSLSSVPGRPLGTPTKPYPLADAMSLAETLRGAGYLTAGFTGGGYLSPNFAFERGFDTYFSFPQVKSAAGDCRPDRFDGAEVFRRGTAWLRDRGRAPFFLFLHTYDVHDRCPFKTITHDNDSVPWDEMAEAGYARLLAYYDDLIAETDTRVGALLSELDALGLRDDTLVVITSDHGELFNEHGLNGHGCKTLYDGLIRVPLLFRYPSHLEPRAPERNPVSLLDVAPTILALLHLPQPATMTGVPLPGLGTPDDAARAVVAMCNDQVAVRQGSLKLIASSGTRNQQQLFDLDRDAAERVNLFTSHANDAQPLLRLAEQHRQDTAAVPTYPPRELDAETKERLRALGYEQ